MRIWPLISQIVRQIQGVIKSIRYEIGNVYLQYTTDMRELDQRIAEVPSTIDDPLRKLLAMIYARDRFPETGHLAELKFRAMRRVNIRQLISYTSYDRPICDVINIIGYQAKRQLAALARDPDPEISERAKYFLQLNQQRNIRPAQTYEIRTNRIPSLLKKSRDSAELIETLRVISQRHLVRFVPNITRMMRRADHSVKTEALATLAHLAPEAVQETIYSYIDDPDWGVRREAVYLLAEKYKDERVFPVLIKWVQHKNRKVRQSALYGLRYLVDPRAIPYVEACLHDYNSRVRRTARFTISSLKSRD